MENTKIQFLGHATFKIVTPEGKIILVDPWLTNNPFIPEKYKTQNKIDLIAITHGHYDHFDRNIIEIIKQTGAKVIANNVCKWYLIEKGVKPDVFENINLGGTVDLLGIRASMVNAFHLSQINIASDKIVLPHHPVGFILSMSDGARIYVAGDTCVFGDMSLISEIYRPNIALLPIGDRSTMGPLEASFAIKLLKVPHIIPCHYNTFPALTGRPEELIELTKDIENLSIHCLQPGDTYIYSR